MTLKKTIAGSVRQEIIETINDDGSITIENKQVVDPSIDVDMHSLEEQEIRAHWAIHDVNIKIPPKPTQQQEHEWLIENGSDFVKLKRDEWQKSSDAVQPELLKAQDYHQQCAKQWSDHIDEAVKLGVNPDTYKL